MPFVKIDTQILNSTLWFEKDSRTIFITALLMAEPKEFDSAQSEIATRTLDHTGFEVPPGWYGFVPAAGSGIIRRAMVDAEDGYIALEKLASPDIESRSKEFQGRRMVRVNGGFVILNYMKYRDRDYSAAERARRYRQKLKDRNDTRDVHDDTRDDTYQSRNITQADSREQKANNTKTTTRCFTSEEVDAIYWAYPRHLEPKRAKTAIERALMRIEGEKPAEYLLERTRKFADSEAGRQGAYTPYPASWFNGSRYNDDEKEWDRVGRRGQ
jgi:hypothetical protein